jgi:hypothetical protein
MAFGLAGLLVVVGVIAWIMAKVELPATQDAIHVQEQAQVMTDQISGRDSSGADIGTTYADFPDMRDDGKLQDLQITNLRPDSALAQRFGVQKNDVVLVAIDPHGVDTPLNGLADEEAGKDAIREAYQPGGQLVVMRGNVKLTLPLPPTQQQQQQPAIAAAQNAQNQPPTAQQQQQQQQMAQKTEKQQEGKSNDGTENGTMDEIHQRLHALPTY